LTDVCAACRTHPSHVVSERALQVYRRVGLVAVDHEDVLPDYIRVCHSLGFYFAPGATAEGANALGVLMVWFFVVDDQIDDGHIADPERAERFLDSIRDVLWRTKQAVENGERASVDVESIGVAPISIAHKLTAELPAALLSLCRDRPRLYQRFLDHFLDWLDAVIPFNFHFRASRSTSKADACRTLNIGAQLTMIGMEIVNDLHLSPRLWHHLYAERLRQAAFRHVILQNDLVSYHQDSRVPERQRNNFLTILMKRHELSPDRDMAQGIALAVRELVELEAEIEGYIDLMRTACRTLSRAEVEAYAKLVYELLGGSWAWSLEAGRYHAHDHAIPELRAPLGPEHSTLHEDWLHAPGW